MRPPGLVFQPALLPPMGEQCPTSVERGAGKYQRFAAELQKEMRGRGHDLSVVYDVNEGRVVMRISSVKPAEPGK